MATPVFVGSGFVAKYPEGGGSFWVPLQYLFGLRSKGLDAYWLEVLPGSGNGSEDRRRAARFLEQAKRLGIRSRTVLLYVPEGRDAEAYEIVSPDLTSAAISARMGQGVLLNLSNSIPALHRAGFACTVLYDIDPGMLQLWSTQWNMGVGEHDFHLTIGRSIGRADCPIPTLGVEWHAVWPTVYLPSWPEQSGAGMRYTTITQWWNGNSGYDIIDGELYDHNKRSGFIGFLDMPHVTGLDMELAANITPSELEDRTLLAKNGWQLVHPHKIAGTPWSYRRYIQSSRGEFSCAKPSVVKASPGWISDRTVCYLASGRPCVIQAAGAERHLPHSLGLQFFTTKAEAVEALHAIERDYARASREARRIATEVFATDVVLRQVMDIIGLSSPVRAKPDASANPEQVSTAAGRGELAAAC